MRKNSKRKENNIFLIFFFFLIFQEWSQALVFNSEQTHTHTQKKNKKQTDAILKSLDKLVGKLIFFFCSFKLKNVPLIITVLQKEKRQ